MGADLHICILSAFRTFSHEGVQKITNMQAMFTSIGIRPQWYVDRHSLLSYTVLGLDAVTGGRPAQARNAGLSDAERFGKACVQISDDLVGLHHYNSNGTVSLVSPVVAALFLLAKMRGAATQAKPQLGGITLNHGHPSVLEEPFSSNTLISDAFFVVDHSPCRFDTALHGAEIEREFVKSHVR